MISIPAKFAIAPEALDEVEKASIELAQYLETQAEASPHGQAAGGGIAKQPIPVKGFRKGYAEHAASVADSIKEFAATGVGAIWQIAERIAQMRSRLNRKEFRAFVSELLEWTGSEARKYLDIERAFRGFDFSRLAILEPFTLLRLRTKRYAPVVERLREEPVITSRSVQKIIKELLPKQPKKKKSGDRDQAILQRHPNTADGTFYYTLKNTNLSDKTGLWLEEQLKTRTVGQVLEQAANRESEIEERDRRIAELEARLAQVESAQIVEQEGGLRGDSPRNMPEVAPQVTPQPETLQNWEEFAQSVQSDRSTLLKTVKDWTPEQRQQLPVLLSGHLEENPSKLNEVIRWVPEKLLKAALANLSFDVQKITGCRFVSLEHLNTRNEQWIFANATNELYLVFGRDDFAIAQF